jgi:hypothetical protein
MTNPDPPLLIEVAIQRELQNDENVLSIMLAVEQGKNKHPFL